MSKDPQAKEKVAQEAKLEASLAVISAKFLKEYKMLLALGHNQPSPLFSLEDTAETLERRYRLIQQEFKGEALNSFSLLSFEGANSRFEQLMKNWRESTAVERAKIISRTNIKQGEDAKNEARQLLISEDTEITSRTLAITAGLLLSRKLKVRKKLIAQTEVQAAYESTKHLKGQAIIESPELSQTTEVVDTWNSVLDGNERISHNIADGQERVSPEPFEVGGSELRFPGDPSGPIKEIINCRCYLTSRVIEK